MLENERLTQIIQEMNEEKERDIQNAIIQAKADRWVVFVIILWFFRSRSRSRGRYDNNTSTISKYLESNYEFELNTQIKENEKLISKNVKLEQHLDSMKDQIDDLKNELMDLKARKKDKMVRVKDEADKYREYFKNQIDTLRDEMLKKKSNMDKMKSLLEEYKTRITHLERELSEVNEKWDSRCQDEKQKEKMYVIEIENKLGAEISNLKKDRLKKQQLISDLNVDHDKFAAKSQIKRNNFIDFLQSIQKEFDNLDKWNHDYENLYSDILNDARGDRNSAKLLINVVDHMKQIMNTVYGRINRYIKKI